MLVKCYSGLRRTTIVRVLVGGRIGAATATVFGRYSCQRGDAYVHNVTAPRCRVRYPLDGDAPAFSQAEGRRHQLQGRRFAG